MMELEGAAHQFVLRKWPEALRKTSVPIEAWKCNFPLLLELMTDRLTNLARPKDRPGNREVWVRG